MKKIGFKKIALALIVILIIGANVFISWANNASPPTEIALQALQSDAEITVTQEDGLIVFRPANMEISDLKTGFVFYPGGRVDYRAYAPILRQIAARGYLAALVPMPLNLAFFNSDAASQVMALYPGVQHWAIGGHSLGGVAAGLFAEKHDSIEGMAFWASYPANDSLKNKNLRVVSIYGTNDGLATKDKIDGSRASLPADAQFVAIEGGNHSQFGSYGFQSGDNKAGISPEDQWSQIAAATVLLLETISR